MVLARTLEVLLLPPSGLVVLGLAGLLLAYVRRRRAGLWLAAGCGSALLLLSLPWVQALCLATFGHHDDPDFAGTGAGAVVVLGAGFAPGTGGAPRLSRQGVERLEHGAEVQGRTGLPILVSGYSGELMARELEARSAAARWIESASRNTHQNAVLSARLLAREGVVRIYLVTHFWHMPRAAAAFRNAGLEVVPAPLGRATRTAMRRGLRGIVPSRAALAVSSAVFHEWAGRAWYRLRYGY